jgi:thiol peroxidase
MATVTFKGAPLTRLGSEIAPGDKAPDFTLIANDLSKVSLKDSAGKVRLLSVVPSLDTGICDQQTRKFNEELASIGDNVVGYTISADLPFAQARWCANAGIENVQTLSDHYDMSFADAYGTHVEELRLDSRAVFVVDADDKVTYVEYVPEIASHPDYEAALSALKAAAS